MIGIVSTIIGPNDARQLLRATRSSVPRTPFFLCFQAQIFETSDFFVVCNVFMQARQTPQNLETTAISEKSADQRVRALFRRFFVRALVRRFFRNRWGFGVWWSFARCHKHSVKSKNSELMR